MNSIICHTTQQRNQIGYTHSEYNPRYPIHFNELPITEVTKQLQLLFHTEIAIVGIQGRGWICGGGGGEREAGKRQERRSKVERVGINQNVFILSGNSEAKG